MKIHGHPWSINTRKVLTALAEKGQSAELHLVMLPKGEHKQPPHLALHPFGKVPVLEDEEFALYETRAILHYIDRKLPGTSLVPSEAREAAQVEQWIGIAESYFIPHAHVLVVEKLFRRFLGGEQDLRAIEAARAGMQPALDELERGLASRPFVGGETFSLADLMWMPYLEYLQRVGEGAAFTSRPSVDAWWGRASERASWQRVARSGPQPYDDGVTADVVEKQLPRSGPGDRAADADAGAP